MGLRKRLVLLAFVISGLTGAEEYNVSRIASVDANATEILVGFGLEDSIVALDMTSQSLVQRSGIPDLGYHRALSAEGLLSTEPSLIVGSNHMGPITVIEALKATRIPLLQLQSANSAEELMNNIEQLGVKLNKEAEAKQLVDNISVQQQAIASRQSDTDLAMVFLMGLNGRGLSKAGHGTTGEALIQLLGGRNMSDYGGYKTVSMEALLEMDPDVILVGSQVEGEDAAAQLLKDHPLLNHSKAVQNKRLLSIDAGKMIAGVSMGVMTEAERLSRLIY